MHCFKVDEGGGWTVIQRRNTGLLDFDRDWDEYKVGFGKHGADDEMWFGTENIYQLTAGIGQGVHVRFELTGSHTSKIAVTQYGDFRVGQLTVRSPIGRHTTRTTIWIIIK